MGRILHVEIARKSRSNLKRCDVKQMVKTALENGMYNFSSEDGLGLTEDVLPHIDSVKIYSEDLIVVDSHLSKRTRYNHLEQHESAEKCIPISKENGDAEALDFKYHTFELSEDGEEAEYMDDEEDDGQSPASHHWTLPSRSFDGLWDSLLFDSDIKRRLMEYVKSAIMFSEMGVNNSLISWNKLILLHGPPGTGKTSLCKAIAQKAVIQLSDKFHYGQLIEINSHSLFSKWFSESGKLVMKMFDKIHELIEDPQCLVFLLIDEVESLAQCRQSAEARNEPTDSIRAVNALLTQIDKIKRYPNVVVLTTSNVVGAIDAAFVDRADLKVFIGPPPAKIIYEIFASCINELFRVGIVQDPLGIMKQFKSLLNSCDVGNLCKEETYLFKLSEKSVGLSGRFLRKIPFLTHANFIHSERSDINDFLKAMETSIQIEMKEVNALKRN